LARILQIDTTGPQTSVALSDSGKTLFCEIDETVHSHAQIITVLIQKLLSKAGKDLKSLEAISINSGPGSYTGLRIGSTTAKGLCLGLKIPLIALNGLKVMTLRVLKKNDSWNTSIRQYCPSIDARRMEVFMEVFDPDLQTLLSPSSRIIDQEHFFQDLKVNTLFFGTGAQKIKEFLKDNPMAYFDLDFTHSAADLSELSEEAFYEKKFENLIDFEPFYLKEFYSPSFKS